MTTNYDSWSKTLIVDLSKHYGGSTSRVLSLASRIPHDKIALAVLENSAVGREAARSNLPVHIVGKSKTDPGILSNMIRLIRKENFQVLDSQNIQSKFWASLSCWLSNRALVSTIHSWYANEHGKGSMKGKMYTALELATNRKSTQYITVSNRDRLTLLKSGFPEQQVELIYNAVEIDPQTIEGSTGWLQSKLNIPDDSVVVVAVGRLVPVKGFDILINAAQKVAGSFPNLVCLIVGDGELKEELTGQINQTGLQDRVRLLGHHSHDDVLKILKAANLFIMPSHYEGTPIALLEAAALGLPIIASNAGGIPELVTHEEHALLIPPKDSSALAAAITRLVENRSYASQLGENAKQRTNQHFSTSNQVVATLNTYHKAWMNFHGKHKSI